MSLMDHHINNIERAIVAWAREVYRDWIEGNKIQNMDMHRLGLLLLARDGTPHSEAEKMVATAFRLNEISDFPPEEIDGDV